MITIISNKNDWGHWLSKMDDFDFYHTYEYHNVLKKEDETPILIVYQKNNAKIVIPFLKRKIDTNLFDLTSVHGYLGPLSYNIDNFFDNTEFLLEFNKLLIQENIVSVFSKLNPFIKNQKIILESTFSKVRTTGEVVYINLELDEESQLKQYNRNTKQKIRQLKKISSISYIADKNCLDYKAFINLYHKGMKRVNAKNLFFFKDNYFDTLLNSNMCNTKMIIVKHNETNEIMGGVFCVCTKEIAQVELAFTNEDYFRHSPLRILFDECRKLCMNNGIKYLNLGGGSGGREGSLMKFKSTFSQYYKDFNVWDLIVNENVYNSLTLECQKNTDSQFFPKYRIPVTNL